MYVKLIEINIENGDEEKLFDAYYDLFRLLLDSDYLFQVDHRKCVNDYTLRDLELSEKSKLNNFELLRFISLLAFVSEYDENVSDKLIMLSRTINGAKRRISPQIN